jgi:hypothetical protein
MFKKSIIALGAAAFLAAGSLGVTTGTASAGVYVNQHGVYIGGPHHHGKKVCKPEYRKVVWRDKWGHKHVKMKYVGQKCWWKKNHHHW